ncbi:conserved hypothetical protein [Oleispira antarctica RB-8]|uniref:DUF6160 domain-containing protein n=1 Tax=Oleispira antarctica RB-8 TaxID=698738 RepID=R4YNT3_OLEAN|nr:conserved hypothetical protein [Oleispira antarctica RB-8]
MKIKTSFLATSILAASSLSHAGFTPIDDVQLGAITGQSGVTIESTIYAEIGSVVYTDEGSIGINDIVLGGANKSSYFGKTGIGTGTQSGNALDGMKIDVDVAANGNLTILGGPQGGLFNGLIDFGISTGSVDLMSADTLTSATLIDSINMTGLFTDFFMTIHADTSHITLDIGIGIDDIDIDLSSALGIRVENAFITSSNYFEELERRGGAQNVRLTDLTADFEVELYADDDGLHVELGQAEFDMGVGSLIIADASVGSFYLNDVNVSGLAVTISGHP